MYNCTGYYTDEEFGKPMEADNQIDAFSVTE
jgi:hypothetical protein